MISNDRDIVELLPDIIYEADLNLNLTYVNSVAFEKFGYSQEDLDIGLNIVQLIDPEYKERAFSKIKLIFEGKETDPDEYLLRKKDGSTFYARVHSRPIFKNGQIVGLRGTINDINEMILAEQKLKESEEKFRTIAEQSFMGIIIIQDGLFKYFNEQARKLNRYSFEEIQNWEPYEFAKLIHPDDKEFVMEQARKKQEGEQYVIQQHKYRIITKTGEARWIENFSKTINYKGKPADLVMSVDITDKINAEQRLKESEENYRKLFENSPIALMDQDYSEMKRHVDHLKASGINDFEKYFNDNPEEILKCMAKVKVIDVNEKTLEVYKANSKEDCILRINQLSEGIDNKMTEEIFSDNKMEILSLIKGDGIYESEIATKTFTGDNISLYAKTSIVPGFESTWSKVIVSLADITDRKFAEQKLKESEEKFRKILEANPDTFYLLSGDSTVLECKNYEPKTEIFFKPEYLGKKVQEFLPSDIAKIVVNNISKTIDTQEPQTAEFTVHINNDFFTAEGRFLYLSQDRVGLFVRTITEKKKLEIKLRKSEEKYRHLYENSPYAILLINTRGDILDCNYRAEELSGFERNKLIGMNFQETSFIPKEYLPLVLDDFKALIKGRSIESREIKLYRKDRTLAWVSYQASIFQIENEMIFQVIIQDITERKKADQKVIESEEKYYNLFETSPNGVILTDLNGTILECNSALERISGYSVEEFIGKNFVNLNFYKENSLEILKEGFQSLFGNNKLEYLEFPIKHKDNHTIWVHVNCRLITMREQSYILAVIYDITIQKIAEEALKKSEEKYRDLLETSSIGVIELDVINKKMTYINPKLLDIIGYEREELTEEIFLKKIMHKKDLIKLLRTNEESELEFRIFDKQGRLKWLSGKRIPNFDENGEIVSIRAWLDDITEKKIYEELIYELNINFLNFTTDIRNNIELLLNTGLKLINGDLIIYAHKSESAGQEGYQIITSDNESYFYNSKEFRENLFINELFTEGHDFPQEFYNINNMKYIGSDPFIKKSNFKSCFGKAIKSQEGLNNIVCIFYKNNPNISGQDKLVLFLICDAIEIEQRRWQVQQDLEKQNITLNEINKLKTELFSRTSHELKTPLISIKGFTELLLTLHKSKLDPETISILEEIKDGGKRLEKIINLLLESAKLEAGQLELNIAKEDLTFLINFCVKELKGLTILRNQSILFDSNNKLEANFDKERIYEVISNLLLNAVKYTPPGGTISIQVHIEDDSYIISIKDDGIGFTEEEKSQAFKQFGKIERYGQGWDVAIEGTGLGLYITKKLVDLHGGKIWLESEGRNKGSTFSFSIPKM